MCDKRRRDIGRQKGISFEAVLCIFTNILGMFKVSARWVPRMLTKDQKKSRFDISKYLLSLYEDGPEEFMCRAMTQDEFWSISLILRPKQQSTEEPWLTRFYTRHLRVSSAGKVLASIFWNSQGDIMMDYLKEGRQLNGSYYAEEQRRLSQEIVKKTRGKLTQGVLHLKDNAPAHTSQVAMAAATKCSFAVLPRPSYSPDLAPSDFYLFSNLNINLRGRNFGSNECVIDAADEYLGGPGRRLLFWRDKQTGTALEKVHRDKGILCWEIMAQFPLLVSPKVQRPRTFWSSLALRGETI